MVKKGSRRLTPEIPTDVMVLTRGPSETVGKRAVSTGDSQKGQLGYSLSLPRRFLLLK
jgi:hypothetical protein